MAQDEPKLLYPGLYQGSEIVTRQGFQIGWELIQVGERGRSPCPFR